MGRQTIGGVEEDEASLGRRVERGEYAGRTGCESEFLSLHDGRVINEQGADVDLQSLRRIPHHPAIIPLYDAFISPKSHELYFVFECMEGNLYQLTKSRRGRPLAAGLIASCFHQITSGLYHIHRHGYFHRDMKPENLLVTTTGLTDYLTASALQQINANRGSSSGSDEPLPRTPNGNEQPTYEKDVSVIVKLADFGLARETSSKPPYTEYVSTRWYRAPEVLLRSREYGAPVDMWALGTILAEMLNLKPLFPGVSEIDQVYRICDTLGDPSVDHGIDERGRAIGGGSWNTGIKLAKNVGFSFPKVSLGHVDRAGRE
jgi:serine/threonine protein kinase